MIDIFPESTFLISDGGPHFTADLFREIASIRGFNHHTVAPWTNGGVERLNQVFVTRICALLNVCTKGGLVQCGSPQSKNS